MSLAMGLVVEANRVFARLQFDSRRRQRLYRELVGLLRSGMSRGEALEVLWRIASRDGKRGSDPAAIVLADARNGVRNGLSLASSLKGWIPREDFMLMRTIEDIDGFADHLESWCCTLEDRAGSRADAVAALAYPGFLLAVAYGLLVYFDIRIMPAFAELLPRSRWSGSAALFERVCAAAADYAVIVAVLSAALPAALLVILPRWSGRGRSLADKLPVFALYRAHSGVAFLQSMGALMSGGLPAAEAIIRIRDGAEPYVQRRLDLIRKNLLNGCGLGSSMELAGTGWPDPELALSLRVLSHSADFPSQILRMAKDWRREIQARTERMMGALRITAFLAVFAVISGVLSAMYEIQGQIASSMY